MTCEESWAYSSSRRVSSHHHIERLADEASAADSESPAAAVSNGTAHSNASAGKGVA
jgi:hypothetical protein